MIKTKKKTLLVRDALTMIRLRSDTYTKAEAAVDKAEEIVEKECAALKAVRSRLAERDVKALAGGEISVSRWLADPDYIEVDARVAQARETLKLARKNQRDAAERVLRYAEKFQEAVTAERTRAISAWKDKYLVLIHEAVQEGLRLQRDLNLKIPEMEGLPQGDSDQQAANNRPPSPWRTALDQLERISQVAKLADAVDATYQVVRPFSYEGREFRLGYLVDGSIFEPKILLRLAAKGMIMRRHEDGSAIDAEIQAILPDPENEFPIPVPVARSADAGELIEGLQRPPNSILSERPGGRHAL